jgi:hypothetical protein
MKTKLLLLAFLFFNVICVWSQTPEKNQEDMTNDYLASNNNKLSGCSYNGIPLHGKVQFVSSFPDFKIQYVTSFPDLNVKFVNSFPNKCGEWQIVESFPDFKVQVVESFPDFKVKVVESFPGLP